MRFVTRDYIWKFFRSQTTTCKSQADSAFHRFPEPFQTFSDFPLISPFQLISRLSKRSLFTSFLSVGSLRSSFQLVRGVSPLIIVWGLKQLTNGKKMRALFGVDCFAYVCPFSLVFSMILGFMRRFVRLPRSNFLGPKIREKRLYF